MLHFAFSHWTISVRINCPSLVEAVITNASCLFQALWSVTQLIITVLQPRLPSVSSLDWLLDIIDLISALLDQGLSTQVTVRASFYKLLVTSVSFESGPLISMKLHVCSNLCTRLSVLLAVGHDIYLLALEGSSFLSSILFNQVNPREMSKETAEGCMPVLA